MPEFFSPEMKNNRRIFPKTCQNAKLIYKNAKLGIEILIYFMYNVFIAVLLHRIVRVEGTRPSRKEI